MVGVLLRDFFFFQAEDGIRDLTVTGVQTCALPIYGKILGRPGLDSKRRELCTLAAIAMQNAPRQLHAHLRGALNTGSSRDEVDEVIAVVEDDLTKDRALQLWEMWADVRERNL